MKGTLQQRFEAKIYKTQTCWIWTGALIPKGYGMIGKDGGRELAHRVAYELFIGPIPEGMFVLHRCDNRRCVNPKHLFLGTNTDNMQDMIAKGRARHIRGEECSFAKLNAELVRSIRIDTRTCEAIATELGLSATTVERARSRKTWRHIQ
jgi:hypothetical protein